MLKLNIIIFMLLIEPCHAQPARSPSRMLRVSPEKADENLQVKTLKPHYPPEALVKGIEGTVQLRIVVDKQGRVTNVKVLSGHPLLAPSAVELVKRFPYRPFLNNGKRVIVTTEVDIPFELHPTDYYIRWKSHRDTADRMRRDDRFEDAIDESKQALEDAKKLGDMEVADTYGDMANLYFKERRYEDAELALRQRLTTLQRSRIQDELEVANTQADLASVCILRTELNEAQRLIQRAIPVQEKYLRGATLRSTRDTYAQRLALSIGYLALLYDYKGDAPAAERFYKRAISLGEKNLPSDDEATIMYRYAELLAKAKRLDEAAKVREAATALQLGLKPTGH